MPSTSSLVSRYKTGFVFMPGLLGLLLLSIDIFGLFQSHKKLVTYPREGAVGVPGYDYAVDDSLRLLSLSNSGISADELNLAVYRAIEHKNNRRITFTENWLLWLVANVYPPAGTTQNPKRIVRGGIGLCSEASLVLNYLARHNGYEARYGKFPAHLVSQIKTDSGWRYFDPDYGISFPAGFTEWPRRRAVQYIEQQLVENGFGKKVISQYMNAVSVDGVVSVSSVDPPLSPNLYRLEVVADWLIWIVPLVLLGCSFVLYRAL